MWRTLSGKKPSSSCQKIDMLILCQFSIYEMSLKLGRNVMGAHYNSTLQAQLADNKRNSIQNSQRSRGITTWNVIRHLCGMMLPWIKIEAIASILWLFKIPWWDFQKLLGKQIPNAKVRFKSTLVDLQFLYGRNKPFTILPLKLLLYSI